MRDPYLTFILPYLSVAHKSGWPGTGRVYPLLHRVLLHPPCHSLLLLPRVKGPRPACVLI
ncbi:hypothetical protein Mapa_010579 [Marchantia paleacea]|nr:hypothetical protein Mapa_010579 [Marchantia paleacea]